MTVTEAPAPRAAAGGGLSGEEVVVAGFQRLLVAPTGTAAPDGIDAEYPAAWYDLGYTTEDGITFSFGLDTDTLMTSQSLDPVRMLTTGRPKTVAGSLRQFNRENLTLALGGGTWSGNAQDGFEFEPAPSSFIDERMVSVEFEDGNKKARFFGRRTMVSEAVEFTLVNTAGLVFPLTFTVLAAEPNTYWWQANAAMLGEADGGPAVPPNPTVTGVTPSTGDPDDTVALAGTNFAANMTVRFGSASATNVVRTSATAASCTVPAGTGSVAVEVTNPGALAPGTLPNGFTYN
jgi:IPT/TIG domain